MGGRNRNGEEGEVEGRAEVGNDLGRTRKLGPAPAAADDLSPLISYYSAVETINDEQHSPTLPHAPLVRP